MNISYTAEINSLMNCFSICTEDADEIFQTLTINEDEEIKFEELLNLGETN